MAPKSHILVVAEERHTRRFLEVSLHARGYATEFATDEKSAIAAVRRDHPSLVLVDMTLPQQQGLRILERFHDDPLARIPVLALVGAGRTGADTTELELAHAIENALANGPRAAAAA